MDCTGKRIAFTGIAANHSRNEIHAMIQARGGTLVNAVNAKTDLLVRGENPGNGTGKVENASKFNVPTMTASAFVAATTWSFGPPRVQPKQKKKPVPAKEVTASIKALSKQDVMPGYVGF